MALADRLESFRAAQPGCRIAVYTDLAAGMALASAAATPVGQETVDELAATAAALLADPTDDAAADLTPGMTRFAARSPADAEDAICCICAPETDLRALQAAAGELLAALAADQAGRR